MTKLKKYAVELTSLGSTKIQNAQNASDVGESFLHIEDYHNGRVFRLVSPRMSRYSFAVYNLEEFLDDWNIISRRILLEKIGHIV